MKSSFASGLKKVFFVAISLLSMATSFLFFIEIFHFGDSAASGDGWGVASTLLTGFIGVLVLDAAAIVWLKVYLGASDNNSVRAIAMTGSGVGFVGSALSSFAYLILIASDIPVNPDWSSYVTYAMAVIIVVHFALVFLSQYKSTQAQIDEKTSAMLSEATDEMLKLTEERFRQSIPGLAAVNADQLTQMLAGQFTNLSVFAGQNKNGNAALPAGAPPTANITTASNQADELAKLRQEIEQLRQQAVANRLAAEPANVWPARAAEATSSLPPASAPVRVSADGPPARIDLRTDAPGK